MLKLTDNLRIENPCPFVPTRMNKVEQNYFCKSCSKTIIDFRGKTTDEIKCATNNDSCGIFTIDQLPGQQKMKLSRRLLFYCFTTILSVLGFSVKPLSAQIKQDKKDTVLVNANSKQKNSSKEETTEIRKQKISTEKRGLFRRKKKNRVIGGCPSF